MKRIFILMLVLCSTSTVLLAQQTKLTYPEPEFTKEVYGYKTNNNKLVRLEKETSEIKSKVKMGGLGGAQSGYEIEGSKSPVRFQGIDNLTFVFMMGYAKNEEDANKENIQGSMEVDTTNMMGENNMGEGMGNMGDIMDMLNDPAKTISLYQTSIKNGNRKIVLQESQGGMMAFSKKEKSNSKYSLSFKKIKGTYYEIVVDKRLPKGEYAFINMGQNNVNNSAVLFAFAID